MCIYIYICVACPGTIRQCDAIWCDEIWRAICSRLKCKMLMKECCEQVVAMPRSQRFRTTANSCHVGSCKACLRTYERGGSCNRLGVTPCGAIRYRK